MTLPLLKRILVSNDDGYDARGLRQLATELEALAEVWIVAPDRERSATSMAMSLWNPVRIRQHGERLFSVDGYPTDCVNIALHTGSFPSFDLVVSGINHGPNLGDDVHYSGTVAAARQAAIHDIRSVAVSCPVPDEMKKDVDMQRPARWVCEWIRANYTHMKPRIVYNVNYPEEKGVSIDATFPDVRYTYQGTRRYHDQYAVLSEEGSERTIQLKTLQLDHLRSDHSDFEAIMENCISVTPLSTYTTHISELKEWFHRTLNESA